MTMPRATASPTSRREPATPVRLSHAPVMSAPNPDRELLLQFRAGDAAAFSELLHRYQGAVYGYLFRCGLNRAACDDLFQDIFIKVSRAAPTFACDRPFKPWLFKIAVNTVRSHFRKRAPVVAELDRHDTASGEPAGDALVAAKETAAWLEHAIAELPLAQREVVELVCKQQLKQADVAEMLELPLNTVKTHLRRARLTLARQLAARNARTARESHQESP